MGWISRSAWSKAAVTTVAALAFASLYENTILDLHESQDQTVFDDRGLRPLGPKLAFSATAYCKGATTTSGVPARAGVAAADPELLPVGSVVQLDASAGPYNGIYTVMDTGPRVRGRELDIYMWSCNEALSFGRRLIHLVVLRHGWNPKPTALAELRRPRS